MNSVTVDGKNYVKAGVIARELGYTGDYVGQLCRAGKVDAQLVGRSWYVNEDSLNNHKRGRYRSNTKETLKAVERTLHAEDLDTADSFKVSVNKTEEPTQTQEGYANQSFYKRATVSQTSAAYHTDETELIPGKEDNAQGGRIGVRLADARSVKIASRGNTFDFNPTERQQLRFKGRLSVMEVEDAEEEVEEETVQEQGAQVAVRSKPEPVRTVAVETKTKINTPKAEKTSKINVKHRRPQTKRKKRSLPLEHNAKGVLSMQRGRIVNRNPVGGTLRVSAQQEVQPYSGGTRTFLTITTVLIAIFLGVLITTLEQTATIVNGEVVIRYTLDFEDILATAYDAFR